MQAIDQGTDVVKAVAMAKGTGATAIKIYADLPPDRVAAIVAEAHRQKMLVWAHSAIFPTRPADVIAAGADAVSHVCYLAYQLEPVMLGSYEDHTPIHANLIARDGDDPAIALLYREMLRRSTILDATGALFVREDAERKLHPERRPLRCTGAQTIRLAAQAWRAGVPISTGTDHIDPADRPWPEMYAEMFFLVREVGMPPLQAIRSATLNGARAAGLGRETGSIEAGKIADLVVLARDPLADIANIESIELTVKRGRVFRRRDFPPLEPEEISDR
jgi:imidazolonepropionase-like amidohydrolase